MFGGHGEAASGLVDGDTLGGAAQRAHDADVAVVRVVQPQLQAQSQPVAHRQRHLEPVRRGDHHVDAVGEPRVDELGHFGQQRVSGVEGVGVVPAEGVEVVDEQEHLAVAVAIVGVAGGGAVLLARPQQLLELTEGPPDTFGFQR